MSAQKIISGFIEKVDNTSTSQMTTILKERINGSYHTRKANFKIQKSPFKLYMKEEFPVNGREVLYVTGENNNKARINPAAFPWTTLSLDPLGNTMRTGSHHSIFKSGYSFINKVLKYVYSKHSSEDLDKMLVYEGLVNYGKILCHKITFENADFAYVNYKVLPGENMEDISNKLLIDDYMVLEKNKTLNNIEDIKPGMLLKVPTQYGKSFVLYFSQQNNMLLGIKIYDEVGLWEEFSYSNVKLNPKFTDTDFSSDNPAYGF
jgi:hypothetical protein